MSKLISATIMNLVTPKAGAKRELLFNKPASRLRGPFVKQKVMLSSSFWCEQIYKPWMCGRRRWCQSPSEDWTAWPRPTAFDQLKRPTDLNWLNPIKVSFWNETISKNMNTYDNDYSSIIHIYFYDTFSISHSNLLVLALNSLDTLPDIRIKAFTLLF